ncbi:MAG: WD40 repeat domain-containing protein [Veillonellaceae bacterium]|nr:WD40 repeat domain-containing protein [Veillonellaceae bacterium]
MRIHFVVIALLLITGCTFTQQNADSAVTPTLTKSEITPVLSLTSPENIPTLTPIITQLQQKTATVTSTPYPFASLPGLDIPTCANEGVSIDPSVDFGIDGSILYKDKDYRGLYLVGGKPLLHSPVQISESQTYDVLGFSSDGKWLAYSESQQTSESKPFHQPIVHLLSYENEQIDTAVDLQSYESQTDQFAFMLSWSAYLDYWLSDKLISMLVLYQYGENGPIYSRSGLLNPFEGAWKTDLFDQLPVISDNTVGNIREYEFGFSPDLSRILFYESNDGAIILWDLVNKKEIKRFQIGFIPDLFVLYDWAVDSSKVAYLIPTSNGQEISIVYRDGTIERVELPPSHNGRLIPYYVTWSPNGENLAISTQFFSETGGAEVLLYVYHLPTSQYIYRCRFSGFTSSPGVFWSPDGQFLISGRWSSTENPLLLFDIGEVPVIKIVEDAVAYGWSALFMENN